MKIKKGLGISFSLLGALMVLLIYMALFQLGPTVKIVAERIGSKALGTPLTIDHLSINPRKGTLHLSALAIANPTSFGSSNAVALANLDIAIEMASLFSPTLLVQRVQINRPHFIFEQSTASDNIAKFIQNSLDFSGYDPEALPKEKKPKKKSEKTPPIVIIQSLEINNARFLLAHTDDPMLNIEVGINQLCISMTNGLIQLKNLQIDNPDRLSSKDLFTLDSMDILIDPESIHSGPLTILDIQIRKPHCFIEWAEDASSVSEFLHITEATVARVTAWPIPKPKIQVAEVKPETKVPSPPPELHKFGITDLQFHLVNSIDSLLSVQANLATMEGDFSKGWIKLDRFSISNPSRLATPDLFRLDGMNLQLDPATLYSSPFSILDIQVQKPYVFLEINPETDTVTEFMKVVETIIKTLPTPATASPASEPKAPVNPVPPVPPLFKLHHLLVDDIQLILLDSTNPNALAEPAMLAGIGFISVNPTEGHLQIQEVTIPNPYGFHSTNMFYLGRLDMELDPESIFSDQLAIHQIVVDSPKINFEQTETHGNIATLQKSLMGFIPPSAHTPDPVGAPESGPPASLSELPVTLKTLLVTNLTINLILPPAAATNKPTTSPLGHFKLNQLNPMTYLDKGGEPTLKEIPLLAFDCLTVNPLNGSVEIDTLYIGNLPEFSNEHLLKLERLKLKLDPNSLLSDTVLIQDILIESPRVVYERKIRTDNIAALQETIEGAFSHREKTLDKAMEEHDIEEKKGQKVIIEHLLVQDGRVRAKLSKLPTVPIPLPTIEMKEIGKEEGGASLGEASSKIFSAFYEAIISVVANTTGLATETLKGAGTFTFDALGNITENLGELVGIDEKKEAVTKEPQKTKKKSWCRIPWRKEEASTDPSLADQPQQK